MNPSPWREDPEMARVWEAFAREDAVVRPAPGLRCRVAASAARRARARPGHRRWVAAASVAVTAAAAAALIVAATIDRQALDAERDAVPTPAAVAALAPARPSPPAMPAPPRPRLRRTPSRVATSAGPAVGSASPPAIAVARDADVAVQMVRVRLEAAALDGLGVRVLGPPPAGLVDVDLVIGLDGWPREVRRIRAVPDESHPD